MNEKHKATLIVSLIITLFAISLVWQGILQHAQILNTQIKAAETELKSSITTMETFSFTPYRNRIKNLLQTSPEIVEAFAARDRQLLYKLSVPKYRALKRENRFFTIMHFHLPDGKAFLRLHKPEFYGDDLTLIRPMITAVHKNHKPSSGFEIGRYGPFFRVVEPIFFQGVYVGAFEFGILANQVLELLETKKNLTVTAYFDKDSLKKSFLFDKASVRLIDNFQVITQNNEIFYQIPTNINFSSASQHLDITNHNYILHTRPIFKNFQKKAIGGVLVLQDITETVSSKKSYLLKSIIFSTLMLILTLSVVYFYFGKVMGTILRQIAERVKTEKALRVSESRFRILVHDLPNIAVQGYDKNRKVVLWNKGSELLYGYSQEEALGQSLEDLIIPEEMRSNVISSINGWIDLGVPIPASELTMRHKDGSAVPVFSSHTLTHKLKDEPELYCVDVDLKELKDAQAKQTLMEQQLGRAHKMEALGLMAGGVAHDLNNILSGIVSYPELLLMQLPPKSPMRKSLETIKESGTRAAAVVTDLLTVARGVAKTTEIANLNNFITTYLNSAEYYELGRRHPHIEIISHLQTDLKNIRCSGVHIMKVITNLMNNAAEAIREEGVITINTSMVTVEDFFALEHDIEPGEYCLLFICDNGPGIGQEDLDRIFEPFFTKKIMGRSGTGLGLAVVWNTMKDHGGVVIAESSEQGCCFNLYFPACDEGLPLSGHEEDLADYQGNGEAILIVDDEKQQRVIAERVLSLMGYQPCTATSGEEAIDYLQSHQVDLVVLDMIMDPGINGKETYAQILKLHPNQKAIIASGFSQSDEVNETLAMGAGQYIKKPYTMAQLGHAVKRELLKEQKTTPPS
ncbi:MAG: response regulator [Thermodesulfobacteriota bacterium]